VKVAIATTTIFPLDPFLNSYTTNLKKFGHETDVEIIIAGDRKSPIESKDVAQKYIKNGFNIKYLDIDWQKNYLQRFPDLLNIIPENSDNRRNVAYLFALEEGADIIISVDDDNFPLNDVDFIGDHLKIGKDYKAPEAIGTGNWFNLCTLLSSEQGKDINLYPRGYPYSRRVKDASKIKADINAKIGINVGLWLSDPDTDAIGRLYAKPNISSWDKKSVILGKGVRVPINTQNTAFRREAMCAYYYVKMGETLRGMRLDRYGDILSGYFVQLCAEAVGDRICIGSPVTDHLRNKHNLLVDLYNELAGIMIVEDLAGFFEKVSIFENDYSSAYKALSYKLENYTGTIEGFIWQPETREYFRKICSYMRIWADVTQELI
jgi:hypothetical protein